MVPFHLWRPWVSLLDRICKPSMEIDRLLTLLVGESTQAERSGHPFPLTIVFVERKTRSDEVAEALVAQGLHPVALHGGRSQSEREAALQLTRIGKATISTDVFAFGAFILEVACGRRPIQPQRSPKEVVLVDWVFENWKEGAILETSDPRLGGDYLEEEMELVLKLGLLCSASNAATRPSMRQVMQYLDGDVLLPEISHVAASIGIEASSELVMSFPPSVTKSSDHSMSCTESIFNSGR
ncbi:hypothetical protein Vadar_013535 [Vaccinium darrowii]|uniref:Uncharacterized protein n=1 Tax=Vaccinium darrowii TaxID=229202 RepID=A0ACB7ZCG7_9ERIC|nr:hypothetical protein Vadar_013535 [Vaccinium darrowii]